MADSQKPLAFLIAVSSQGFGNHFAVAVGRDRGAAEIPLALLVHPSCKVTGASLTMLGLALGGQAEPLFGPFVCFLLWHDITSILERSGL